MKLKSLIKSLLLVLLLALSTTTAKAAAVGTEFLYQGALTVNGSPANGAFEMIFTLFRQGETNPRSSVSNNNVAVSLGLFTVKLDFGAGVFDGTAYELGIAVRQSGGSAFVPLTPRQLLTATPNSLYSETARSVPDSALSGNVARLNGSPMFSTPVGVTMLRVANAAGGGVLNFGNNPDNLCAIAVDPRGPAGLLLRDPQGIRILSPDPVEFPPVLRFGPTDDCSIGIDPFLTGLILRDPGGLRIAPATPALPRLLFGPTDDCSLGIDPAFPGLVERDPIGFRLLGQNNQGCRLIFGPTMDCTIEVRPPGTPGAVAGLLLRDPSGIRLLSPDANRPPTLRFGPTDDCSLGIDPVLSGLIVRDPSGFRLLGRNNQGRRLIFGPTMDCTIEVQAPAPNSIAGLLLRDPNGIRILNPVANGGNTLVFGPTDDCSITVINDGMRFADPRGFFFSGPNGGEGTQVTVNGSVSAQSFIQTSSRRFKNEVKPIEQPLEKIAKLQGVRFTWNKEQGGRQDIGFIAEEVGKVIPEVVSWEEDGQNARGVNYDHLVAVAIEGIKAQQTKIEILEREKTELKESVASLQEQLDRLARKLETVAAR